ncbi:MAG TPA: integrin alpha [Phycisphaerae bacterium]|nr:integrin alpha [Phycisphaerae bacterium]
MTRIRRSWQRLGLLLGLSLTVGLLSGQGCPMSPPAGGEGTDLQESDSEQLQPGPTTKDEVTGGPTVQVIYPLGGERIEVNSIVEIRVFGRHPSIPDPTLRIFYDRDTNTANGTVTIATIKASVGGTGWDTTGLATGAYYIGVEMVGVTPPVVDYCDTSFQLVPAGQGGSGGGSGGGGQGPGWDDQEILLTVGAPRSPVTLFWGRTFQIRWSTNLLPGQGTAEVFREPDFDEDGLPDGHALRDLIGSPGMDAAAQRIDFDTTGVVGRYFIGVTVKHNDGRVATAYSPAPLIIQPTVFNVGMFGTKRDERGQVIPQSGSPQGAVLKGHNFYDNLGSAMLAADDYDGDGRNEIVVAAQFAKPFNFYKDGRGAGEAYMLYGQQARLSGDIEVNSVGSSSRPGVIFAGIVPNPFAANEPGGNPLAFEPEGKNGAPPTQADRYATEGLRSLTLIPDQDNDGKRELVFGFPWCNSISLWNQAVYGIHPHPEDDMGRLENDGHFLRGGTVIVSSANSLLSDRQAVSDHYDRVIQLHEVGQIFQNMSISPSLPDYRAPQDHCTLRDTAQGPPEYVGGADDVFDTATFPCEGFYQDTLVWMDPPRLADPFPSAGLTISPYVEYGCWVSYPGGPFYISLNQVDPVPGPTSGYSYAARLSVQYDDINDYCTAIEFPQFGYMSTLGTGFYGSGNSCATRTLATPREPYGCRILGQTTTQLYTPVPTTANRFGTSVSVSGDFLMIGAPMRTARARDIPYLEESSRHESGVVYLLSLKRPGMPSDNFLWSLPGAPAHDDIPAPHNYVIKDLGYIRTNAGSCGSGSQLNSPSWEIERPIQIVGANPTDRIGDSITGLYDINNDGVADVAVGGAGTNSGRGAVYVIYRRQPEIEHDYLLERLQLLTNHPDRMVGLFIIGEQGENLGTALGGLGPAAFRDDYNADGFPDLLIGSPNATPSAGFEAGQVFILFGGKTLLNAEGGVTIRELVDRGDGMLLTGVAAGDRTGEVVASAGDVNGDGVADLLIAAPNASVPDIKFRNPGQDSLRSLRVTFQYDSDGDGIPDATGIGIDLNGDGLADPLNGNNERDVNGNIIYDADDDLTNAGVVYLVFGGTHLKGTIRLDEIGSPSLPGLVFVGRAAGNELGGGRTQNGLLSRGLAYAGDLDGDGYGDVMISSVLADPDGKTDAGEVYVVYGFAP